MKQEFKQFNTPSDVIIDSEKNSKSHEKIVVTEEIKLGINNKKIDENQKLKQHEILINQANLGKKTLKISDTHRRSVYYESDRDIDLSSDYRSSEGQAKKNEISITGEKIISIPVNKIIDTKNQKNVKLSYTEKSSVNHSEINHIKDQRPMRNTLPKKQIKEGYLKINDDEDPSPNISNLDSALTSSYGNDKKIFFSNAHMKQFSTNISRLKMIKLYESPEKQSESDRVIKINIIDNPNGFKSTAYSEIK